MILLTPVALMLPVAVKFPGVPSVPVPDWMLPDLATIVPPAMFPFVELTSPVAVIVPLDETVGALITPAGELMLMLPDVMLPPEMFPVAVMVPVAVIVGVLIALLLAPDWMLPDFEIREPPVMFPVAVTVPVAEIFGVLIVPVPDRRLADVMLPPVMFPAAVMVPLEERAGALIAPFVELISPDDVMLPPEICPAAVMVVTLLTAPSLMFTPPADRVVVAFTVPAVTTLALILFALTDVASTDPPLTLVAIIA
jgi:hypothetical protein